MADNIFGNEAPKFWEKDLPVTPVEGKAPIPTGWTGLLGGMPSEQKRADWLKKYRDKNIGLLLGAEIGADEALVALDVDDDRLINLVLRLLGLNRRVRRSILAGKRGKKGATFFVLAPKSLKSTVIKGIDGLGNIDFLAGGKMTVMPPSIHPDTGKPYEAFEKSLLDVDLADLPEITEREINLLKVIIGSQHVLTLISGQSTHDAGLAFCAQLLASGTTDEEVQAIFRGLLPDGYDGNTLDELQGWIDDGRKKGFDQPSEGGLPVDETIARAVERRFDPLTYSEGDGFMRYTEGHWRQISDADIDREAKKQLIESALSSRTVSSHLKPVRVCLSLNVEKPGFGTHSDRICVKNGTVNLTTGKLEPHSPDHQLRFQLNVEWDPKAECPVYDEHIKQVLMGDEKAIALFDEFAAHTLVPEMRYQKALYLMGPGGSGKSTLLRAVAMMHDPEAISVAPLDKIDDERHRTQMARKLVNISYDIQTQKKVFGETFIRITGGDAVTTRRLYQEVEGHVQPTVRFLGSMNPELPGFIASPDALQRRLILLPCGDKVTEPDPDRFEKLMAEKAGILNRYVAALLRLRERGRFDVPDSARLEVDDYVTEQDPFDVFVDERLVKSASETLSIAEITRQYNYWADEAQTRRLNAQQAGMKLKRLGFEKVYGREERDGRQVTTRMVFARFEDRNNKKADF